MKELLAGIIKKEKINTHTVFRRKDFEGFVKLEILRKELTNYYKIGFRKAETLPNPSNLIRYMDANGLKKDRDWLLLQHAMSHILPPQRVIDPEDYDKYYLKSKDCYLDVVALLLNPAEGELDDIDKALFFESLCNIAAREIKIVLEKIRVLQKQNPYRNVKLSLFLKRFRQVRFLVDELESNLKDYLVQDQLIKEEIGERKNSFLDEVQSLAKENISSKLILEELESGENDCLEISVHDFNLYDDETAAILKDFINNKSRHNLIDFQG